VGWRAPTTRRLCKSVAAAIAVGNGRTGASTASSNSTAASPEASATAQLPSLHAPHRRRAHPPQPGSPTAGMKPVSLDLSGLWTQRALRARLLQVNRCRARRCRGPRWSSTEVVPKGGQGDRVALAGFISFTGSKSDKSSLAPRSNSLGIVRNSVSKSDRLERGKDLWAQR
jgi:hypothetical protein